jgi:hypothetical protein
MGPQAARIWRVEGTLDVLQGHRTYDASGAIL